MAGAEKTVGAGCPLEIAEAGQFGGLLDMPGATADGLLEMMMSG